MVFANGPLRQYIKQMLSSLTQHSRDGVFTGAILNIPNKAMLVARTALEESGRERKTTG